MLTNPRYMYRRPTAEAVNALSLRVGIESNIDQAGSLRGASLVQHAQASLRRASIDPTSLTADEIFAAAFTQGVSDFPILLESVAHKVLQQAFVAQPHTWRRFCKVGQVNDFRDHTRVRVGSIESLKPLLPNGEFKTAVIPDGERARVRVGTRGLILNVSRQALINDDLGALTDLTKSLGEAAARSLESDAYAVLALNGGLGPVLEDGKTLFHASRGNFVASGAGSAPSHASFVAARTSLGSVKDSGGNDFLDIAPAIWLGPLAFGGAVRQLNDSEHYADPATALPKANSVRGMLQDVVDTPRLSGAAWRIFADPNEAPALEMDFLNGLEEPIIESVPGFDVDGTRFRVLFDYGVSAVDWRGAYMNAGL